MKLLSSRWRVKNGFDRDTNLCVTNKVLWEMQLAFIFIWGRFSEPISHARERNIEEEKLDIGEIQNIMKRKK